MIYLIKDNNKLRIMYSKENVIESGYKLEDCKIVALEEFSKNDGSAYIDKDGNIQLGHDPVIIKNNKIRKLKQYLEDTDYIVLKIAEGDATREDYAEELQKRQKAREEIRELEK